MTTNKQTGDSDRGVKPGVESLQAEVLKVTEVGPKSREKDWTPRVVERCQTGDHNAFKELFEKYSGSVHRHLSVLMGPGCEVDDLVQLVFLNVFNSINKFEGKSTFSTWLFRITINVARQEIRQRGRHRRLGLAVVDLSKVKSQTISYTPESRMAAEQQVYSILNRLSQRKRESFILYTYEGYSLEEIAELLGSSVSTIGSRLQAARKDIMKVLTRGRAV